MAMERASGAPPHAGSGGGQTAGLGNSGKSIGAGRPDRNAMNLDFITPKYSWDQANIGNFGITGAVANMLKGIWGGNTYNQGTPQGFSAGGSRPGLGGAGEKSNSAMLLARQLAQRSLMPAKPAAPAVPWVNPFAQTLIPRYKPGAKTSIFQGA